MKYPQIAALLIFLTASPALAQQEKPQFQEDTPAPMPKAERQMREKISKSIAEMAKAMMEIRNIKEAQCMRAIGDETLCGCIADESPMGVDFVGYVKIVSSTSADLNYDELSAEDKKLVDATRASRGECVGQ